MRYKEAAGFGNQTEFFCPATNKEKDRSAKIEALVAEGKNDMVKATKSYTELIVERVQEVDPSMDFLSTSKKVVMQKFYSKDPTAMPIKEIKPLRFNKLDKFAAKIESDVDIIGNAAVESIKALEGGQQHQVMFHLINIVDIARDTRSEANLKRLQIRDAASTALIKKHVEGANIVSPTIQEVIKEEKNQGFKKQNYYYEESNLEFERINSDSSSSRTLSSTNKESQLHINPNPNGQYLSNVRNQPKNWCSKSVYDNQKNLVFDKPKQDGFESGPYSRKIRYDNRQTEWSENEQRLLSPPKNLSIHSRDTKILSNNGQCLLRKRTSGFDSDAMPIPHQIIK
jgi:hypothetical protein